MHGLAGSGDKAINIRKERRRCHLLLIACTHIHKEWRRCHLLSMAAQLYANCRGFNKNPLHHAH